MASAETKVEQSDSPVQQIVQASLHEKPISNPDATPQSPLCLPPSSLHSNSAGMGDTPPAAGAPAAPQATPCSPAADYEPLRPPSTGGAPLGPSEWAKTLFQCRHRALPQGKQQVGAPGPGQQRPRESLESPVPFKRGLAFADGRASPPVTASPSTTVRLAGHLNMSGVSAVRAKRPWGSSPWMLWSSVSSRALSENVPGLEETGASQPGILDAAGGEDGDLTTALVPEKRQRVLSAHPRSLPCQGGMPDRIARDSLAEGILQVAAELGPYSGEGQEEDACEEDARLVEAIMEGGRAAVLGIVRELRKREAALEAARRDRRQLLEEREEMRRRAARLTREVREKGAWVQPQVQRFENQVVLLTGRLLQLQSKLRKVMAEKETYGEGEGEEHAGREVPTGVNRRAETPEASNSN